MRKTSAQILKEIKLDRELAMFEKIDKLKECLSNILNFRSNELESLLEIRILVAGNSIVSKWVDDQLSDHARKIIANLGVTVEGFKTHIEHLEGEYLEYKRRNKAR